MIEKNYNLGYYDCDININNILEASEGHEYSHLYVGENQYYELSLNAIMGLSYVDGSNDKTLTLCALGKKIVRWNNDGWALYYK